MVINRCEMKRRRREESASPLLDDSPKRTKVHAQRKFAQGSNVNSPVITPVKEIEKHEIDVLPEPVELLPIKRPNTEDFLTFLCFRGTPILPPTLNFFNTASIVDTNGQVHEIKSESPKNGPIDTSAITKTGSGSSERPFVAFGVRKRADPIVISRQMDKKRRHALALQALRRKYQEQRMAKIRAVAINKLSEKTSKTLVRSNSVTKNETVVKKTASLQKTKTPEPVKSEKMATRSVKAALRPQIKQKMCLRSFRGRFVQKELQFRNVKKRALTVKQGNKSQVIKTDVKNSETSEYSSDDEKPLAKSTDLKPKQDIPKIAKKSAPGPKKPIEISFRITRSKKFITNKIVSRRQQIKQRLLLNIPATTVKPRTLRSQTSQITKQSLLMKQKKGTEKGTTKKESSLMKKFVKSPRQMKKEIKTVTKNKETGTDKRKEKADDSKRVNKTSETTKKDKSPTPSMAKNTKVDMTKKTKVATKQTQEVVKPVPKKDNPKKKVVLLKTSPKTLENAVKKETIKKKEPNKTTESESEKKTIIVKNEQKESVEQRVSQRPTRKTKEAAAIYMEILSHKLVNEGRIDDDNVSIDSFPELPNVKRTEQRENELKAKAKGTKTVVDSKTKVKETIEDKAVKINDKKKTALKRIVEEHKCEESKKNDKSDEETFKKTEEMKKVKTDICDDKRGISEEKTVASLKEELKGHIGSEVVTKESSSKKSRSKVYSDDSFEFISDEDFTTKSEGKLKSGDIELTKRQTRNSSQNIRHAESDDSDESFRVDIRIPRKKQITRSKVSKCHDSDLEKSPVSVRKQLRAAPTDYKEGSSSESDQSTTSDINIKPIVTNKNKKFTKMRCQLKEQNFSDSDEEPLSKLTQNKNIVNKENTENEDLLEKKKEDCETKSKDNKQMSEYTEKPKRECAKRPQNYLPMFSSSDEEENFFQGFKLKETKSSKATKLTESTCLHTSPSLDLSCKDIGRRFGKGKVNMSNEQIEKWLKDSAMAGISFKTEHDAMLKFGEKIPTETSLNIATSIDTEQLKNLLICSGEKQDSDAEKKEISPKIPEAVSHKHKAVIKPLLTDRKLIFRNKDKCGVSPNINAFSVSNESSVYAFGEDDDLMKAPFRRPTRRPSSTATSRSEDESSKCEELSRGSQFRKPPLVKQDSFKSKEVDEAIEENMESESCSFYVPSQPQKTGNNRKSVISFVQKKAMEPPMSKPPRNVEKLEWSEELKYKVPSSPSASSSSSAKLSKRQCSKAKLRSTEILPVNLPEFPTGGTGQLIEAPTFHPSEKEFQDPLEYIEKIRSKAEQFGICRIVPPSTFKPECKVTDDMRFTAYNQYVHKMLHRWGPNFKELMAIKKYLSTQNITLTHPPWIGGMEIDLPRLYQTVQSLGGLKEVIEKKKWSKVSDVMKIPKSAQDRVTKLDDIYCKYLLPYDTLSPAEREKLFDDVETEWAKRESKSLLKAQQNIEDSENTEAESESDDEAEECIVKGRSMALNAFYRIARNTMSMWFKTSEPLAEEVEHEFWKHVTMKENHICVHSGSIDSGNWGYGFAVSKNSPFARHAWNLKVLTNNSGSVLRSLGPVMGVTVPTLHVGMVFSSCCWYRDPHSLPWIEYLHTGGSKIWYGIPDSVSGSFHAALKSLVPNYCRNKALWLPSDTVMVPPNLLVDQGVSLCRIVQEPGQFIVVFPKAFTSSLSTGYVVSESVYFAPPYWLKTGKTVFNELRNSCEPSMFSFDRLLLSILNDTRTNIEVLKQIIPAVQELCDKEKLAREKVKNLGVTATEKLPLPEARKVRKKKQNDDGEYECEICRMNLFVSMVTESQDDVVYCLDHAAEQIVKKKIQCKHCKLTFTYDDKELDGLVERIQLAITNKMQKKLPNKYAGMPTLLTK